MARSLPERFIPSSEPTRYLRVSPADAIGVNTDGITISASAALNRLLQPRVKDGVGIHSFHLSLPAIECPVDRIDDIGGWTTEGVGHKYGKGHSLTVMHGWIRNLVACH